MKVIISVFISIVIAIIAIGLAAQNLFGIELSNVINEAAIANEDVYYIEDIIPALAFSEFENNIIACVIDIVYSVLIAIYIGGMKRKSVGVFSGIVLMLTLPIANKILYIVSPVIVFAIIALVVLYYIFQIFLTFI